MGSGEYFSRHFEYVAWADRQCLAAAATVPERHFRQQFGFGFGSVHVTLIHLVWAQWVWLDRLRVGFERPMLTALDLPTLTEIATRWQVLHAEWLAYLSEQTEATLDAVTTYPRRQMTEAADLRTVIAHVLDHATYHRGQLNSLIRIAGGQSVDCGRMTWARLHGHATTR